MCAYANVDILATRRTPCFHCSTPKTSRQLLILFQNPASTITAVPLPLQAALKYYASLLLFFSLSVLTNPGVYVSPTAFSSPNKTTTAKPIDRSAPKNAKSCLISWHNCCCFQKMVPSLYPFTTHLSSPSKHLVPVAGSRHFHYPPTFFHNHFSDFSY